MLLSLRSRTSGYFYQRCPQRLVVGYLRQVRWNSTIITDKKSKVLRVDKEGIANLFLNDDRKRNALSLEMLRNLQTHLVDINHDFNIKVVIIQANKDSKVFSSGHDLKELSFKPEQNNRHKYKEIFETCSQVMLLVQKLKQPVIAKVNGIATAAGCQLVASCDLAYASPRSSFGTPGVNIGLFCSTPAVPLARSITKKHAMQMLLTGELIHAYDAKIFGLINDVIDEEKLDLHVEELAKKIGSKSSQTVSFGKEIFNQQIELPITESYKITTNAMIDNLELLDAKEGISAFLMKRKPIWK